MTSPRPDGWPDLLVVREFLDPVTCREIVVDRLLQFKPAVGLRSGASSPHETNVEPHAASASNAEDRTYIKKN